MSGALQRVREKFRNLPRSTDKADRRASVSSVGTSRKESENYEAQDLAAGFDNALQLGTLVLCASCRHFEARTGSEPDGWCRRHGCESWARVPLPCAAYEGIADRAWKPTP